MWEEEYYGKKCIVCGEIEKNRKRVFVPITFCPRCGNREFKMEYEIINLNEV